MNIGDRIKVEVIDINHDGLGVAKLDGMAVFIPNTIDGEEVLCEIKKINKNYLEAKLIEVIKPSKYRVRPICPIFYKCGGCDIQHMEYKKQLEYKISMAQSTLRRIGHIDKKIDEIIGMDNPYYYRNKIQVPFTSKKGKTTCGYYMKKSHEIVPIDQCFIQPKYDTEIVNFIKNLANEYKVNGYNEETREGVIRHVLIRSNYLDEVMIVLVTNTEKIYHVDEMITKIVNRYPNVISIIQNINKKNTNVILGEKSNVLYGKSRIVDKLNDLYFDISHYSFFQINREQTEKLYNKAIEFLNPKKDDIVIDGYCGVGTISLNIAKHVKHVYGIEIVEDAIVDARNNAKLNNITNVDFIVGKVEEKIFDLLVNQISGIVIDPPRKGVEASVLEGIMKSKINKIVYVSCDVATLARDLEILSREYEIKNISLVDMFCQTTNVETVVCLERK